MNPQLEPTPNQSHGTTRRRLLTVAAIGGAGIAVAGCSTYGAQSAAPTANADAPAGGTGGTGDSGSGGSGAGGAAVAKLSDIPVGGGVILADQAVVVTQPTKGTVKAFSAVCTHAGCTVSGVADGVITCPCHGSAFRVEDGSVAKGPARTPLPAVTVRVDGDAITLA